MDPSDQETDPRYADFGVAPKGVADFALLLHDLYHVKPSGIMTIVLPHGVLYRGGAELQIRSQLVEHNHIDAIIGLPEKSVFGTGISTIVMVLSVKLVWMKIFYLWMLQEVLRKKVRIINFVPGTT